MLVSAAPGTPVVIAIMRKIETTMTKERETSARKVIRRQMRGEGGWCGNDDDDDDDDDDEGAGGSRRGGEDGGEG